MVGKPEMVVSCFDLFAIFQWAINDETTDTATTRTQKGCERCEPGKVVRCRWKPVSRPVCRKRLRRIFSGQPRTVDGIWWDTDMALKSNVYI